ncbi:hypothetical protein [uncultured Salegentibacter sp.]|uniref:hypothetical protein n=1 Tax=uncultured Salegentibacter sp. TaxID=259320 RepID=UPI0030D7CA51
MRNSLNLECILFIVCFLFIFSCKEDKYDYPEQVNEFIEAIEYESLGKVEPNVEYQTVDENITRVTLSWNIEDTIFQDDWRLKIKPEFEPNFHWSPHLTPTGDHIIPQHVFRSPALVVASDTKQLSIVPDIDLLDKEFPGEWYMDLNAPENELILGLSQSRIKEHVLYTRESGAFYTPGKLVFGFYIMTQEKQEGIDNPWRGLNKFFWENWGNKLYEKGEPLSQDDMEPYVKHTYNWAFHNWKDEVWQYFENDKGKEVGAPIFIVNVTKSPNFPGESSEREFVSIWNQAWFSSLRSASGLYRYARRTGDDELLQYALKTKELALSFPQKEGFFYSVVGPVGKFETGEPWRKVYFGNSNRNPYTGSPEESPFHILDMSFTAYLMLCWFEELEKDQRLLNYAKKYAEGLLKKQDDKGFFPGWLDVNSLKPMQHLNQSPETSMSVTFLLKLFEITGEEKYKKSALKAMEAIIEEIIPSGRWEDFETYWSCSRYGSEDLVNQKVERNNMYKQNNFSIYWTAQALLKSYKVTVDRKYLEYGQRTLDELLMTQATWQPPFMYVPVLGGFGVMNADAEWNDSRQSLFSELILEYGDVLNEEEYTERGIAALKASFSMMYCPENEITQNQWEARYHFFGKEDYGFMMENYGHNGTTSKDGIGIGEFTIYDWGNGAASEAYNRIIDHYGKELLMGSKNKT